MKSHIALFFVLICLTTGCTMRSHSTMSQIQQGQTMAEVETALGKPDQTEFQEGLIIWKYNVMTFSDIVPYYLVFKDTGSGEMKVISSQIDRTELEARRKSDLEKRALRQKAEEARKPKQVNVLFK